ncbi:hypothetical protein QE429_003844 [Bacillus sp. SORGH_AS 510]|uniref:hypothetical protein n=1 Tax=Bacillus sp. SORGH_AS_0510 TaxID=3041771 RepID=UPI00277EAD42|nr:hypothetical protein [Bacillus sp. SORGH_AS_0510]MDQ1147017.1 hypothetical protein [Bacillus sp. SORGH_AS_0510]
MYHYNYGVLVKEKQIEIEKKSIDTWKSVGLKKESLFQKLARKFFTNKQKNEVNRTNYCVRSEC